MNVQFEVAESHNVEVAGRGIQDVVIHPVSDYTIHSQSLVRAR